MARHSHFHNIQLTKGKADAKRAKTFAKHAKSITALAKSGGVDPMFNVSLRVAIDSARRENMPKDNIDRAIARGSGEGGDASHVEEVIYEGFGPGGLAILVQCLTDNRNRSVTEVRTLLSKNGGTMGNSGAVMWMFEKKGVIVFEDAQTFVNRDEFDLAIIDAGAEDLRQADGLLEVVVPISQFKAVLDVIDRRGAHPDSAALEYVAKEFVSVNEQDREAIQILVDKLEALDDVDVVYTNEA